MADTNIDWADKVWNPVTGCTKVSVGCQNCYAEPMAKRLQAMGSKGYEKGFGYVVCHEDRLEQPLHWRKPRRIFVNSMGDLFHDDVPFEFIDRVFAIMVDCKQHTFIILTKRPDRMLEYTQREETRGMIGGWLKTNHGGMDGKPFYDTGVAILGEHLWPLPNVVLGVSGSNQEDMDKAVPLLLKTPAAKRIVSFEPALDMVDLKHYLITDLWYMAECGKCGFFASSGYFNGDDESISCPKCYSENILDVEGEKGLDLVIMGGESGPNARPMHPEWPRSMRDQSKGSFASFWFKQVGEYQHVDGDPADWNNGEIPLNSDGTDCRGVEALIDDTCVKMRRVGKRKAGNLLDGVEHREWPT